VKLLDRYVLSIFIPALAMFTLAFVFLFLTVDFASKLGKFLELKTLAFLPFLGRYYLCRLPMILAYLIPMVTLFAPMFTVIKLARTNEILPIATSGTSLRRMALPFIIAAFLATFAMAALDEFVLANVGDEISDTEEILNVRELRYSVEDYDGWTKLWGRKYNVAHKEMSEEVRITRLDDTARTIEVVTARICRWNSARKRWIAFDGWIEKPQELVTSPEGGKPRTRKDPIPAEGYVVEAPFKPDTLRKSTSFVGRLGFAPLRKLRDEARRYPHVPSVRMRLYGRFSFPLSPVVLLLIGLPFVVAAHSKSFVKGLFFCFLLAFGYYMTHFACMDLGNRGSLPPAWAAFGPAGAFGLFGLASFARMKT
jgi:lipopolysaccharide export LptBFGC system permease protein LptF